MWMSHGPRAALDLELAERSQYQLVSRALSGGEGHGRVANDSTVCPKLQGCSWLAAGVSGGTFLLSLPSSSLGRAVPEVPSPKDSRGVFWLGQYP